MKFLTIIFAFSLMTIAVATEDIDHTLTDGDNYGQIETPTHITDASNYYGEAKDNSRSETVIAKADQSAKESKEFRKKLPSSDSKRDIASQNKIDSNWTEELTDLHKMDED